MIKRTVVFAHAMFLLGGCAVNYGPNSFNGGYSDQQINNTTYFIRYNGPKYLGNVSPEHLSTLWDRRATELCGGKDFDKDVKNLALDDSTNPALGAEVAVYGMAYCNNRFFDTRKQNADANFAPYINLPYEVFEYKELTPLWDLLIEAQYSDLQKVVDDLLQQLNEQELSGILNTFSRINPIAEEHLTQWVESHPESFVALYSRSLFYHYYSWFKRGNGLWKDLDEEQISGLEKYRELAISDVENALSLNPKFCPAHALKLELYTSMGSKKGQAYNEMYDTAEAQCPESITVRTAHLRYLLPRWHGSKKKMEEFIQASKQDSESFSVLDALYLAEEGDQLRFKDNFEQALEKYNQAMEFGSFTQIYVSRAFVLEQLNRYVDAVGDYEASINMSPYNDSAYEGLTRVLLKQNNLVGALIASSYLTTMNNQSPENFELQGNIFYMMRRYEDALVSYKKAAILSSNKGVYLHKIKMTEFQLNVRKDEQTPQESSDVI